MNKLIIWLLCCSILTSSCSGVQQFQKSESNNHKISQKYSGWMARIYVKSSNKVIKGTGFKLQQDSTSFIEASSDSLLTLPNSRIEKVRFYKNLPLQPGQAIGGALVIAGSTILIVPGKKCTGASAGCSFTHDVKVTLGSSLIGIGLFTAFISTIRPKYHEMIY